MSVAETEGLSTAWGCARAAVVLQARRQVPFLPFLFFSYFFLLLFYFLLYFFLEDGGDPFASLLSVFSFLFSFLFFFSFLSFFFLIALDLCARLTLFRQAQWEMGEGIGEWGRARARQ